MTMVETKALERKWQELRGLAAKAKEATQYLDGYWEVTVEPDTIEIVGYLTNQYGERIVAQELTQFKDGRFWNGELMCYSSSAYGLGTCRCISHEPWLNEEGWGFSKCRMVLFTIIEEAKRKIEQELEE